MFRDEIDHVEEGDDDECEIRSREEKVRESGGRAHHHRNEPCGGFILLSGSRLRTISRGSYL